jgi:hypothetical protein
MAQPIGKTSPLFSHRGAAGVMQPEKEPEMRIGIVDLDTSHPKSWIPILRELGHEIAGVWDGGSVHPSGYAEQFAQENGISKVFPSVAAMVNEVDCAILHGCDWDTHIEKARPFAEARKSLLIDKPMAGRPKDLEQITAWSKQGVRISGGSSLRFCKENREFLKQPLAERGETHTVICGCGVDEFNYGIHAYSMLSGLLGPGIGSVVHLGTHVQHRIQVNWTDGRMGFILVPEKGGYVPFHATIVTDKMCVQYRADSGALYRALLESVLPFLSGQTDEPPVPIEGLLEPEYTALAARKSMHNHGVPIHLSELAGDDSGFDGAGFAVEYRAARYSKSK